MLELTSRKIQDIIFSLTGYIIPTVVCTWIYRMLFIVVIYLFIRKKIYIPIKERQKYIRNHIDTSISNCLSKKEHKFFIETRFQNIPPSNYLDIMESIRSVSTENMIKKYLADIFTKDNNKSPLYCVLGGSGMGKTSFLVNLLRKYVKNNWKKDASFINIDLVDLSKENFENRISSIVEPRNTILLLDALDENPQAVLNYDLFISNLENLIQDFYIVVITCRTQFFSDEENELKESKLRCNGKQKGFYSYTRHYISPFTDEEVEKYLRRRYRFNIRKRKKAHKIINQCTSFAHRPLLLSYIDSLIENERTYDKTIDIYEHLIEKWLERDISHQDNTEGIIHKFKVLLQVAAVKMYNNFNDCGIGYCLTRENVSQLLSEYNLNDYESLFKGRSLLNRDSLGQWKFAHKSFLEYFLAKEYYENDLFELDFNGLDIAHILFKDLCQRRFDNILEANDARLTTSNPLSGVKDVLEINYGKEYCLRYIEPFTYINTIEIDTSSMQAVSKQIKKTNIQYVKIYNYSKLDSLNWILKYPQIKFVLVMGDNCSNGFLKESKKSGVAVLNNEVIYNLDDIKEPNVPYDFKTAYYVNDPCIPFIFLQPTNR